MGTEIINGGPGAKIGAQVNGKHELKIRATQHAEEHFISQDDGEAYFVASGQQAGKQTLTFLAGEVGDVLFIKNTGVKNLVISSIQASANAGGGIMTIIKNRVEAVLSQNTPIVPNNINFGSSKLSTTEVQVWDETNGDGIQGLSNGQEVRPFQMPPSPIEINVGGAVIIPQGKSLTVNFNNLTGGTIEFECGFRYYFDDEE